MYVVFPYDYEAAKTWSFDWVSQRAALNLALTFVYYGFWNLTLYILNWDNRKFNPANNPTLSRQIHNCWYTTLGALQWTAWEVIFVHMYATGKLSYVSNEVTTVARPAMHSLVIDHYGRPEGDVQAVPLGALRAHVP